MGNKFIAGNPNLCIGCGTCMAACMMEHPPIDGVPIPRLALIKTRQTSVPISCHHCQDAPCVASCPEQALYYEGTRVEVRENRCIGCSSCVLACPYGAIEIVLTTSTKTIGGVVYQNSRKPYVLKCDLCVSKPEGPACVSTCLTKSLKIVDEASIKTSTQDKRVKAAQAAEIAASQFELA
ncbi:MAG: 4Fe-4S dicluster domain-containing protein [Coriobacteriales bacterium]|jgi:electron transport protein HydN|nr:4Fe-4S dicluster domain-containing protein [Coriobacteriales bacterium]